MPPRKTKNTKSKTVSVEEAAKFCPPMKDGYGAHWHALIWIVAVTVLLSSATMIYAGYAITNRFADIGPATANARTHTELRNISNRLDLIEAEIHQLRTSLAEEETVATSTDEE